jgi:hypothetical protein
LQYFWQAWLPKNQCAALFECPALNQTFCCTVVRALAPNVMETHAELLAVGLLTYTLIGLFGVPKEIISVCLRSVVLSSIVQKGFGNCYAVVRFASLACNKLCTTARFVSTAGLRELLYLLPA